MTYDQVSLQTTRSMVTVISLGLTFQYEGLIMGCDVCSRHGINIL